MNSIKYLLKEYFMFLYSPNPKKVVRIGAIKREQKSKSEQESDGINSIRFRIGLIVTYTMTFLIILDFICIVIYPFIFPERTIPTILRDSFITLLGYFGGTLVSFGKSS